MTSPGALRWWTVAGPEVARVVNEFEALFYVIRPLTIGTMRSPDFLQLKEVKSLVAV